MKWNDEKYREPGNEVGLMKDKSVLNTICFQIAVYGFSEPLVIKIFCLK